MMDYHGSIVAFEGSPEIVSTQLRLLPISTQILVLPSVQNYMPENPTGTPFDARSFVLAVHEASVARRKLATDFLKDSSPTRKKLVFLNGGAANAHAFVITTIIQRKRLDGHAEAEAIFGELVKHGVRALSHHRTVPTDPSGGAHGTGDATRESKMRMRSRSQPAPAHRFTTESPEPMPAFRPGEIRQGESDAAPLFSEKSKLSKSPSRSPSNPVIEQAAVLNLAPLAHHKPPRRARSLERPAASRAVEPRRTASVGPHRRRNGLANEDGRRPSWLTANAPRAPATLGTRASALDLRSSVVCKPSETTISRPSSLRKRRARSRVRGAGTGADTEPVPRVPALDPSRFEPSEPVLPLFEDLIIHFINDTRHVVLEAMLRKFQARVHAAPSPAVLLASDDNASEATEFPETPTTPASSASMTAPKQLPQLVPQGDDGEYDPFRPQSLQLGPPSDRFATMHAGAMDPPTPAQTPPPSSADGKPMFRELPITGMKAAVNVQDALRSVLDSYFPSNERGYSQSRFPFLPENEGLWRPVFGAAEASGTQLHKRKLNLIVALGAQNDVSRPFLAAVTTQVENIGNKTVKGCATRTGRLDLRYLIANAMQTFLVAHPNNNVFANPIHIATLIIPQLEIYLAAHTDVRFVLLEYPAEHLATVLALQRLAGPDVVKVAGVVTSIPDDKSPTEPSSPAAVTNHQNHPPVSSANSKLSHSRTTSLQAMQSPASVAERLKFSQANFSLVAGATDAEIATFITAIWRALIDTSPLYIPKQLPSPAQQQPRANGTWPTGGAPAYNISSSPLGHQGGPNGLPSPVPSGGASSAFSGGPPPMSRGGRINGGGHVRSASPAASTRSRVSVVSTRTTRTIRSFVGPAKSRLRGAAAAALAHVLPSRPGTSATTETSLFDYDPSADSDYDPEERRLMPLFGQRGRPPRKGNSHKALKWLGLA
ncbi:hypothetical protein RB595_004012 [Gaeumannomyces hyphopodioides]